ncbi:MAG TPA: hypothetical protein VK550_35430 [Polyangiaceae bacterium]|jgi:hypothetical protein|nr:hypothetical protein [Polyangiaceae bacterium]
MALLGSGCVEIVSHRDEYDAGPDIVIKDSTGEAEVSSGSCTSGQRWTGGNTPSANMAPGRACLASGCHTPNSKVPFTLAGTIYPAKGEHDDQDCNGLDGVGVAVVPMDDMGVELGRIQVNSVGNFSSNNKMLPPSYKVKVIRGGVDYVMKATVTNGDCNYCHTPEDYMGAKGRIVPTNPP